MLSILILKNKKEQRKKTSFLFLATIALRCCVEIRKINRGINTNPKSRTIRKVVMTIHRTFEIEPFCAKPAEP